MSMRMIECNVCGEPLAAANDDELLNRLRVHVQAEHNGDRFDEQSARDEVANEAYDASDS
jgi:predicted small metal-binding protein